MQTEQLSTRRHASKDHGVATPDVRQGEHAECGIAALAILLGFHGVHVPLADLRRRSGALLFGSTLRHLRHLAESEGFKATAHRMEPRDLKAPELPLIAHMRFMHFVVVESVSDAGVCINDPSLGPMVMTQDAFARDFTGIVLKLQPRQPRRRGHAFSFARAAYACFRPQSSKILAASILCVTSGITAASGLAFVLLQNSERLFLATALLASATLAHMIALFLTEKACLAATEAAGGRLLHSVDAASNQHFLFARPERTIALFSALKYMQTTETPKALLSLLWVLSLLMTGAVMVPLPVLPVLGMFLAQCFYLLYVTRKRGSLIARFGQAKMPAEGVDTGFLTDTDWYRIGRSSEFLFTRLAGLHALKTSDAVKTVEAWIGPDTIVFGLDMLKLALPILLLLHGQIGLPACVFGLALAVLACLIVPGLKRGLHIAPLKDALLYLNDLPTPATIKPLTQLKASNRAQVAIVNGGWCPAEGAPPILSDVNLSVVGGKVLAVHGPPGCGMTTLARLASGILAPTHGSVQFHGRAILVDHRLLIVPGTIRDNLRLQCHDMDDATLLACLNMVDLKQTVEQRGGLDSVLKADQPRFSGGQLRRLMIARALCHGPDILVLDEALDNIETELARKILSTLRRLGLAVVLTSKNRELAACADHRYMLGEPG